MEGKYCVHCGKYLSANDKFCSSCGTKVQEEREVLLENPQAEVTIIKEEQPELVVENVADTAVVNAATNKQKSNPLVRLKKYKKIIVDCLLLIFSIILFSLSFCDLITLEDEVSGKNDNKAKIQYSVSVVDFIGIMGATSNKFEDYSDLIDSKLAETSDTLYEDFDERFEGDYIERTGKYKISKSTSVAYGKYIVSLAKMRVSTKDAQGGGTTSGFIILGIVGLLSILFSFTMLVLSALVFAYDILKKSTKLDIIAKACFPVYLAILLLLVFLACGDSNMFTAGFAVAGCMIAAIVVCSVATLGLIVYAYLDTDSKRGIQKTKYCISMVCTIIMLACAFAPIMQGEATVKATDGDKRKTYEYKIGASILLNTDLSNGEKIGFDEVMETGDMNTYCSNIVDTLNVFKNDTHKRAYYAKDEAHESMNVLLTWGTVGREEYYATEILSAGYYLLVVLFLLSGVVLGVDYVCMRGVKTKKLLIAIKFVNIVVLMCVLACNIVFIELAKEGLRFFLIKNISVKIDAGIIVMLIFAIAGMIAVLANFKRKTKAIEQSQL